MTWTTQTVLDLAPDASGRTAGQALAQASKWPLLARDEHAVWGEVRGSGKKPYQVRIDLREPAFKCSCPSRKFPCKHGLALLLIFADKPEAFDESEPPEWVSEWIAQRDAREEKRTARTAETTKKEADPQAQARRAAKREERARQGAVELALWLRDLVRQGLAAAQMQPDPFWERMAARMVDAQASGLARYVRQLGGLIVSGDGWQNRTLAAVGRLHLLLEAFGRIDTLPPDLQQDVRSCIGWNLTRDQVAAGERRTDTWCVIGQRVEREDALRAQRTWLYGTASERTALILQFAHGSQPFEMNFAVGARFEGELAFYPGRGPLRAIVLSRADRTETQLPKLPCFTIGKALDHYARALAAQPWLEAWPMYLGEVTPSLQGEAARQCWLHDAEGAALPLAGGIEWELLAVAGGDRISVFGEWQDARLRLMSITIGARCFAAVQAEDGPSLARVA